MRINSKSKIKPSVYGLGFIGEGKYRASVKGVMTPQYRRWINMMERCYSPLYHKRHPTYKDCSVCDEWLNFQNFAKWFDENKPKDNLKYHLDKDLKFSGNKIYSPEFCSFVSPNENITGSLSKSYTFTSPSGEIVHLFNLRKFCRENGLHAPAMSKVFNGKSKHHKGWTK